jgi:glycosyltransferase involved in cell wall biosynthesis
MRVLNVFTRFHATDGIATHTVDLTEALSFAACEVSFLSGMLDFTEETKWKVARLENTCKSFEIDPRLLFSGGKIHTFKDAVSALRQHVKREAPDIIHMHGRALWPVAKALRLLRVLPPCITTVHQEPEASLFIVDRLAGRLFCSDRVIAISSDMKKPLAQKMGIPVGRIEVVPHGVNVTYFRPPREDEKRAARARFGLPETGPVACYLGRFSTYKGIDIVIKGVAEAVKECPDLRMIIAGEGHEQPDLEQLVGELHLKDNINFLGRQSPRAVCWAADFILLGSTREGFALSIVEAMACGVVPLRTPSAGAADQIKHGVNGFIFPFWDFETLGKQLTELCTKQALREKLAKGALHTARSRFSGTAMAKATMKVYRRAIDSQLRA